MINTTTHELKQALLCYISYLYSPHDAHLYLPAQDIPIGILAWRDKELECKINNACIQVRFISIYTSNTWNNHVRRWENWDFVVPHKSLTYTKWYDVMLHGVDAAPPYFEYT